MRFLLTNDDGIDAPGLWAAAQVLSALGSVLIVAPARNHSGYGLAHPPSASIAYEPYPVDGTLYPGVIAYALEATPAACAHIGLSGALAAEPVDLVVSGVNAGLNLGYDVLYSGTVGAALTAQMLGWPALAVSLDWGAAGEAHWEAAGRAIRQALALWQHGVDRTPTVFNVNVPNLPLSRVAGVQITTFGSETFLGKYQFATNGAAPGVIRAVRQNGGSRGRRNGAGLWEDSIAVAQGYVSITPMRPFPDVLCVVPWVEAREPAVVRHG